MLLFWFCNAKLGLWKNWLKNDVGKTHVESRRKNPGLILLHQYLTSMITSLKTCLDIQLDESKNCLLCDKID